MEDVVLELLPNWWPWRRVPDVVGMAARDAWSELVAADVTPVGVSDESDGYVAAQAPPAGSRCRKRTGVDIVLSPTPPS